MLSRLIVKLRALLNLPVRLDREVAGLRKALDQNKRLASETGELRRALDEQRHRTEAEWKAQRAERTELRRELARTRKEFGERLRECQLQISSLGRLLEEASPARKDLAAPLPLSVAPSSPPSTSLTTGISEWLEVSACPGCGTTERTLVCEWNKAVLMEQDLPADAMRYDYALCHGCGLVYATRRPTGASYRALTENFSETIGRGTRANADNALLNPYRLSDQDRQRYAKLVEGGVFVSAHEPREHIEGVYVDRTENAAHVEILAHLLDLRGARVLEVRSRAGTIASGLRRQFGASVAAMPIFEGQQFILRSLCGIECSDLIDFDMFTIPFEGAFDLIACNHMLTHVVRVDRFFDQLRQHVKLDGHLYLYGELDEDEFLVRDKSLINTLNPLHLQAFDGATLVRLLRANGFDVVFIKKRQTTWLCLARHTGQSTLMPMSIEERDRRIEAYARARARAILRAPEAVRGRFGDVWEDALARGVADGVAQFDDKGRLRLAKAR